MRLKTVTIAALCALSLTLLGDARAPKTTEGSLPKVTALVCTIWPWVETGKPELTVVAGPVAGTGWVGGEDAEGLMHKGDRLTLYALETGVLGEVVLTSAGKLDSEFHQPIGAGDGVSYEARIGIPPRRRQAYERARQRRGQLNEAGEAMSLLAAWSPKAPAPRWVAGELLDRTNSEYRKVIGDWLSARGVPAEVIASVEITQIARADINGDKRAEVFLSFHTPDTITFEGHERATKKTFSYLLMRYLPPHSRRVKTVVVADDANFVEWVEGFCHLDADGVAEVITHWTAYESDGVDLKRWVGGRFIEVGGHGWGV